MPLALVPKTQSSKVSKPTTKEEEKKDDAQTGEKDDEDSKKKVQTSSGDKDKDPPYMSQEALNQFYQNPLMHMQYYQKGMHPFGMPPHPGMHPYFSMPPGVPMHHSYH